MKRLVGWSLAAAVTLPLALSAVPVTKAIATQEGLTSMTKIAEDGRVISLTTGTGSGECRSEGSLITCADGSNFAAADLWEGCAGIAGSGNCLIVSDDGSPLAAPSTSSTDITCRTGSDAR